MSFECIEFEMDGATGVATMTLNRPDAANAMNPRLSREMLEVAIRCDEDTSVRAVVIRAKGKMFCAGGDLKSFHGAGEDIGPVLKAMTIDLHGAISRFARMDAPVLTEIQGMAAGAGMSLAICGDLAIAAESAAFTMAYTAAGLSPDGSSTFFLPRLVGVQRAKELMLTNRRLDAREAAAWGLVNRVVPDDRLREEVEALACSLAAGPSAAYGSVKRLLDTTFSVGLETQMELEAREITENARGRDGREGIAAFLNKRKPVFEGRRS